jgi:hypothetical protein
MGMTMIADMHATAWVARAILEPMDGTRARVAWGIAAWGAVATAVVGSGLFARAPAPVLPGTIVALTVASLVALAAWPAGRAWAARLPLDRLAWFHAWRLAPGAAFLWLLGRGELPAEFAGPGGVGDIAVALTAPLAAWLATRNSAGARVGYLVWTALGTIDLANVVRAGAHASLTEPSSMHLLRELPLGLLPTFAVPITFAAHALAALGWARDRRRAPEPEAVRFSRSSPRAP